MKFFLLIVFSAATLTIFGLVSRYKKSCEDARVYREQRKIELSQRKYNDEDWNMKRVSEGMNVTYVKPPKHKTPAVVVIPPPIKPPVVVASIPLPIPQPVSTPHAKRIVTARDYRKDYVYAKKWVNGKEVAYDYESSMEKKLDEMFRL